MLRSDGRALSQKKGLDHDQEEGSRATPRQYEAAFKAAGWADNTWLSGGPEPCGFFGTQFEFLLRVLLRALRSGLLALSSQLFRSAKFPSKTVEKVNRVDVVAMICRRGGSRARMWDEGIV